MEDLSKIKERIAKLLAMAEDTSSPEEAAIAASRARKLMDKYQLEAFQCSNKIEEAFAKKPATRVYASVPEYMSWLATAIAKYNDVQAVYEFGEVTTKMASKLKRSARDGDCIKAFGKMIVFRGYESDVNLAIDMYNRLLESSNKACKSYLDARGFGRYPVKEGTAFKAKFCAVVGTRLESLVKDRDELTFEGSVDLKKTKSDLIAAGATADDPRLVYIEAEISKSSFGALVVVKTKAVEEKFGSAGYKKAKYSFDQDDASVQDAARAGRIAGNTATIVQEIK